MNSADASFDERTLLRTLAVVQFTHVVDFMTLMPLGVHVSTAFGISDAQFGLLVSAYTGATAVAGFASGVVVDRFERKRLLMGLTCLFALAMLACALAQSYALLLAARAAAGLIGGMLSALVQVLVADTIAFERRGRALGVVMTSTSLSALVGVPASALLADRLGWQAVFVATAAASFAAAVAIRHTLPSVDGHLRTACAPWRGIVEALSDQNHWRAFVLVGLVGVAGFTTIPFLALYVTSNMGLDRTHVPLVYLAGGGAAFVVGRAIGIATDRWGCVRTFRFVVLAAIVPLIAVTHLGAMPPWAVLAVTTSFFALMSSRMVPGSAILAAASAAHVRGPFIGLKVSVHAASMALGSLAGAWLIGRDASGLVTGYAECGWMSVGLSLIALWWAGRIRIFQDKKPNARARATSVKA